MKNKTLFLLAMMMAWCVGSKGAEAGNHVKTVTSVSRVLGDGRKVARLVIEYDEPIRNKSLGVETFSIEGREVVRTYANTQPETAEKGVDGKYVIVELKTEVDLNSRPFQPRQEDAAKKAERDRMQGGPGLKAGWSTGGEDTYPGSATAIQLKDIKTKGGKTYKASDSPIETTVERTLVADDFVQREYVSPYTGQKLPYNLYVPADYDPTQSYPLVLFIHDAGVASGPLTNTLYQGNGATSWAEPEAQARHKCIVVAPEYPFITVDDNWNYSHHLDATIALLRQLQTEYSIDADRIYTMGQSMGCMSSIVMLLKEPHLFAGALLVAGKWNPAVMAPLSSQNIWIISCEGDASSNTLLGEAVARWRDDGRKVSEATWEMTLTTEQFNAEADKMRAEGNHLLFTHLVGGNHRATWFVAYGIPSIQDWLFEQRRK
ncbi:MAG: alpha/beta hydrolase-fold protein [Prevotella sp.]